MSSDECTKGFSGFIPQKLTRAQIHARTVEMVLAFYAMHGKSNLAFFVLPLIVVPIKMSMGS